MSLMTSVDYIILATALLLPCIFGFSILFGLVFGKEPKHF